MTPGSFIKHFEFGNSGVVLFSSVSPVVIVACVVISYFLGSIPTGFLWGKARGIDIRTVGSGNIGATNVMRALGKGPGIAVLVIDALKGFLPVFLTLYVIPGAVTLGFVTGDAPVHLTSSCILQIMCCVSVIAGHNWTCWLKFKGGKGVATSAGALLAFLPLPLLCGLGAWLVVFVIWRYVSLASICAAIAVPIATWLIMKDQTLTVFTAIIGVVAIYKHKSNIQRLVAGTESRVGARKTA